MLKISSTRNFNLFKSLALKNFRDYRNTTTYFRDYRYKNGDKKSPYAPQFTLTETEREGRTFISFFCFLEKNMFSN